MLLQLAFGPHVHHSHDFLLIFEPDSFPAPFCRFGPQYPLEAFTTRLFRFVLYSSAELNRIIY